MSADQDDADGYGADYWRELDPNTYLDDAAKLHGARDSPAIIATAFRLMLQRTFVERFHDGDHVYFIAALAGLSSLYLIKSGPIDGFDAVFLSRLPLRTNSILFNQAGKLRVDVARRLYDSCNHILGGAGAAQKDAPTDRSEALLSFLRQLLARIRTLEGQIALPPKFADRPVEANGERLSAFAFFAKHWAWRAEAGDVFLDDLRDADLQLYQALAQHQARQGKKLTDLIPSSPTRGRKKYVRTAAEQAEERRRATRERVRRHRKTLRTNRPTSGG